MQEKFEAATLEIFSFESADVITDSNDLPDHEL